MTADIPADPTWPDLLTSLLAGEDLPAAHVRWAMDEVMSGEANPISVAAFLVALRAKGETVTELRGLADVMLEHAHRITVEAPAVDIVGTGGDRAHTVNISTMAAVVVAGAGVTVVKHGNRAASSSSGAADVLEALGVDLGLGPDRVAELAREVGITFCFAQTFHPSFRHAAPARSGLGIPTAFNVLGPLTNPAQPPYAAIGVANPRMAPLIAGVLADRGSRAAVFRGEEGLDELSIAGPSRLWWVADGEVSEHLVDPGDVGLGVAPLSALRGADAAFNAEVARRVLAGERSPVRDAVVYNAGAALAAVSGAAGHATADVVAAIGDGMRRAEESVDSGTAAATLDRWVTASHAS
ncbi:Anthranilate phosphoribosyltransferase [Nostocoides japonicum T1-X7]|uniref:Anthranilate phosphoribosyltransferase n=1 Tax=Nostocoides japonicum T1-X7 TaxID=1194083 RepID=A0A077M7U2_9MICO|nr:anthranilate phosphoribosyltransferase [Tetrasphaera japonica]CCH80120.1 Anthranilate phosphoribosyltransferase [Tetrasphaera japonica T1-X7]